jgi:hypothetical protein
MTATNHFSNHFSDELLWIATVIHSHGIAVIHVGSGACWVPGCRCEPEPRVWSYTIGFAERGHPEVITFGLHPTDAITLSNEVCHLERHGYVARPDDELMLRAKPVRFAAVPDEWACSAENPMGAWFRHYEIGRPNVQPPDVVQLLWADDDDYFPDESGCDAVVAAAQPYGAALATPAWCAPPDRWLRARLIESAGRRRFT